NASAFSRQLLKLAENAFRPLKLSPAHASLLLQVYEMPGISPKDLSQKLHLTPSTITRFIDALVKRKLLRRKSKGKTIEIHPTDRSLKLRGDVAMAYKELVISYTEVLGMETARELSTKIASATDKVAEKTILLKP
ncbi:MAG: MarR family transcriptional regulator, partial [Desulfobacterales bacterium]|nr:MarR family transcriptional regulator [Desulfobacterales bacterium]